MNTVTEQQTAATMIWDCWKSMSERERAAVAKATGAAP